MFSNVIDNVKCVFTIEKPKEIHIQSWREIVEESISSHGFRFRYEKINFDRFWTSIFQDDFFSFAAKNEDIFMGVIVARINETYYHKIIELDLLYVHSEFRKIGVARSLINKVELIAKEYQLDLVIRDVEKSNLIAQKLFKNYQEIHRTSYLKKPD